MIMFPTGYIYPVGNIYPVDNILYPVDNTISINFYCCPQDIKCCPQDISTGYNLYFSKDFRREGGISCGWYPVHHILYPVDCCYPQDIKSAPQDITHRIYPTLLNKFPRRGWYILWMISCTSHCISCGLMFSTGYKILCTRCHPQDISYISQQMTEKRVVYPVCDILCITFFNPVGPPPQNFFENIGDIL